MQAAHTDKSGKYLTFMLGDEEYGLEILRVREIIGLMSITEVPRTPPYVRGVINLRGKIIPVVDLRVKFGMETVDVTEETCIIVVDIILNEEQIEMGILVDKVSEVLDILGEDIEDAPAFGTGFDSDFILGMAKVKESVKILLNIGSVLNNDEVLHMADSVEKPTDDTA
jgi:purine-binding chemotaxis protein CheW